MPFYFQMVLSFELTSYEVKTCKKIIKGCLGKTEKIWVLSKKELLFGEKKPKQCNKNSSGSLTCKHIFKFLKTILLTRVEVKTCRK
jgi:hypothetical protein